MGKVEHEPALVSALGSLAACADLCCSCCCPSCRLLYAQHSTVGHNAHVERLAELAKFCHDRKKVSSWVEAVMEVGSKPGASGC